MISDYIISEARLSGIVETDLELDSYVKIEETLLNWLRNIAKSAED